jgi:hypothetical protein
MASVTFISSITEFISFCCRPNLEVHVFQDLQLPERRSDHHPYRRLLLRQFRSENLRFSVDQSAESFQISSFSLVACSEQQVKIVSETCVDFSLHNLSDSLQFKQ